MTGAARVRLLAPFLMVAGALTVWGAARAASHRAVSLQDAILMTQRLAQLQERQGELGRLLGDLRRAELQERQEEAERLGDFGVAASAPAPSRFALIVGANSEPVDHNLFLRIPEVDLLEWYGSVAASISSRSYSSWDQSATSILRFCLESSRFIHHFSLSGCVAYQIALAREQP